MSKTETLRRLSDAANEKRIERLANQIESLRQAKHQSAEDLAATLEPLAQAMAALADETRQTLAEIDRKSREQGEKFSGQINAAAKEWKAAAAEAQKAAEALNEAGQRMEWRHYLLAALVGMVTAAAVTASWLWLAPPTIENQITLDAQSVAEQIRGATVPAKPSRSNKCAGRGAFRGGNSRSQDRPNDEPRMEPRRGGAVRRMAQTHERQGQRHLYQASRGAWASAGG